MCKRFIGEISVRGKEEGALSECHAGLTAEEEREGKNLSLWCRSKKVSIG